MVNAVSGGVPTCGYRAMDSVTQAQLQSPGAYTTQDKKAERPKQDEGDSFVSTIAKAAVTAAVIGGAVAAARTHTSLKNFDVTTKPDGIANKAKYYAAKAGDYVNNTIIPKAKGFFHKGDKAPETNANDRLPVAIDNTSRLPVKVD